MLLFAVSSRAQPSQPDNVQAFMNLVNRPVVLKISGMDEVRVKDNVLYKKEANADFLLMDLYTPPNPRGLLPVVILIHGGVESDDPIKPKDWGFYRSWGRLVAASGMAAVTFNHRVGFPNPNLEQGDRDVSDLIAFVRSHAQEWGLDPNRICLASYSAGGPMLSRPMRDVPSYIRALVAFYSFLDIQQSALHKQYMSPEQLREFSPIQQLAQNAGRLPPIFVTRAGRDQIPDLEPGLDRFVTEAIARNASLEFWNHSQGVHGFDNQNDDERSREIVRAALEFMRTHLEAQ
jgi:acetyl esterase/lipase